jgi:asparagine synthase (glutamine-hydrolysing)
MCGIYVSNCLKCNDKDIIKLMKQNQRLLRHRGPDCYYTEEVDNVFMAHHRLAIMDISSEANQPFVDRHYETASKIILSVNGEIYNYKELYSELYIPYKKKSESDCEVIIPLYYKYTNSQGITNYKALLNKLDGMFSFVLYDSKKKLMFVARDPYGITSLYYGFDKEGFLHVSSELKAFQGNNIRPKMFPAGYYMLFNTNTANIPQFHAYYTFLNTFKYEMQDGIYSDINDIERYNTPDKIDTLCNEVNKSLTDAVYKRLQSNVPFTMLLSGGLDSSLVCSIACKILRGELPDYPLSRLQESHIRYTDEINTFSIGFEGSPDLEAAQRVADYLGTKHHSIIITIEEAMLAIRDVIWHLETYDVTTIRASTPMFLLARKIKALGYKMVLSGEGSDEVLGGYLYFLNSPSDYEHSLECVRRVSQLQYFDNLRANKSTMAWGLEARVPFLDRAFVELGLSIPSELKKKNGVEKWILREAFNQRDTQPYEYLPQQLLWRQKEQFSDGVGYQWIDTLRQIAEDTISQVMMSNVLVYYPINTPRNCEEYRYRAIFEEIYPDKGFEYCVQKWVPNMKWDGVSYDPSGRAQKAHTESDGFKIHNTCLI